ncbi:MAG: S49 family peptidase [Casimicrobium sp.]
MHYARIASRLYNAPLLITPDVASTIGDYVQARIAGSISPDAALSRTDQYADYAIAAKRPPYLVDQGVAVIEINGELVNRGAWIGANSGLTSYEGIVSQLKIAKADDEVRGVMLVINSPGGEAAGLDDVTAAMKAVGKPVWAIANTLTASAAYWIAAASDRVASVRDGFVGSIGVVWMHLDRSAALEKAGLSVTVVQAGSKKTQFSQFSSLAPEARAKAEALVSDMYGRFTDHVATARSIDVQAVRDTEAEVFTAADAKKHKLIDVVSNVSDFHASMVAAVRKGTASRTSPAANKSSTSTGMKTMTDFTHTQADVDAAKAQAKQEGIAEGVQTGIAQERARVGAILGCDEAKGRQAQAQYVALKTAMSPEDAKGLLAASPAEAVTTAAASVPKGLLADAMSAKTNANPEVGGSVDQDVAVSALEKAKNDLAAAEQNGGKVTI